MAALALAALLATPALRAEIRKPVSLESTPPGAQVYLVRGGQRTALGSAPLVYEAEFHSEMSILRFVFERPGHAPATIEVSARDDRARAVLEKRNLRAVADAQGPPAQRAAQQRLGPALEQAIHAALSRPEVRFDVPAPAQVREVSDRLYAFVPVRVERAARRGEAAAPEDAAAEVWRAAGEPLSAALQARLPKDSGLAGFVVQADLDGLVHGFSVNARVESSTEMECMPGYKQVLNACARQEPVYQTDCRNGICSTRQSGTRCASGWVSVPDPCASRAPVTRRVLKTDPQAASAPRKEAMYIVAPLGAARPSSVLMLDASGKTVYANGDPPAGLSRR